MVTEIPHFVNHARLQHPPQMVTVTPSTKTAGILQGLTAIIEVTAHPDGTALYIIDMDLTPWRLTVEGGEVERVTWVQAVPVDIAVDRRDGRAFVLEIRQDRLHLTVYDRTRRLLRTIPLPAGREFRRISASPDGRAVLLVELARDTARSKALWGLSRRLGRLRVPGLDLRSRYSGPRHQLELMRQEARSGHIAVLLLDTNDVEFVASFSTPNSDADWHPDGKHLIAQGDGHLWRIPLPEHLWSEPAPGYSPPD